MNTPFDFSGAAKRPIVYVREVAHKDLPEDLRTQLPETGKLYALHDSAGERLALVKDRRLAFLLARQNDLSPVTVH
ncbi:DUF1150 family protein [uncultured Lentibacter sp.]|jgi:hypothetical protein|uniref:DUF1150 family protein n=1 Tax=uncultured Lentibacter sp. TaxID=1659309 RepID=UPI002625D134|nr:DUF1150 family protein [uncultured Lentibacter sp.]